MYIHLQISTVVSGFPVTLAHALHTAINHVLTVLEMWSLV